MWNRRSGFRVWGLRVRARVRVEGLGLVLGFRFRVWFWFRISGLGQGLTVQRLGGVCGFEHLLPRPPTPPPANTN